MSFNSCHDRDEGQTPEIIISATVYFNSTMSGSRELFNIFEFTNNYFLKVFTAPDTILFTIIIWYQFTVRIEFFRIHLSR